MSVTVRSMTEGERQAMLAIPKPLRKNAMGMALFSMVMAIMVNFTDNQVALIMPLMFCFVSLGFAVQARKSSGTVAQALARGTVTEVRGTPRWKGARAGWEFGTFSISRIGLMDGMLVDGVPAAVTIVPEAKCLLSVNGVSLRKPVVLTAPAGFENTLVPSTVAQAPQQMPVAADMDLPPPPDGWAQGVCPQCGKGVPSGVVFCDRCGFRLKP